MKIYFDTIQSGADNSVFPLERVRMMAAFEGNSSRDQKGNTLMQSIRITKQDEQEILAFFNQLTPLLSAAMATMLDTEAETKTVQSSTNAYVEFNFKQTYALRKKKLLPNAIAETYALYALHRWLADKDTKKAEYYDNIWQQQIKAVATIAYNKARPVAPTYT